jgi:TolB-like protein/DNA-binding winged helix-turn-helix (wHTH) protein
MTVMTSSLLRDDGSARAVPYTGGELSGRQRFGEFEVDLDAEVVTRDGVRVALAPQPYRLLRYLLPTGGRLVGREELKQALWSDTFVDFDRGLNFCVLQLRTALADDARQPRYLETVPRKGYRFVAEVASVRAPEPALAFAPLHARSRVREAVIAAIVLLVIVAAILWQRTPARSSGRIMLAVLPLQSLSGDADFADGLTEETISSLAQLAPSRLGVVARASVERYRNPPPDVRAAAARLGADYILEGSVRHQGPQVRTSFELIRGSDGTRVWSSTFEREAGDVAGLQSLLAGRVARALEVALLPRRQVRHDAKAFDEYLRGRAALGRRSAAALQEASLHLGNAVALEPRFASAHAALAETWHLLQMRGKLPAPEARVRVGAESAAALRDDPALAAAHSVAGMWRFYYQWDFDVAEHELDEALRLNPSDGGARHDLGWLLMARGRIDAGIAQIRAAQELDPLSPRATMDVAWACIYAGRFDDAIAEARRLLGSDPEFEEAHSCLQQAYELKGDISSAAAEVERRMRARGRAAEWAALASLPPGVLLQRVHEARLAAARDAYRRAAESAWLGRKDDALRELQEALRQRDPSLPLMALDPMLRSLRGERGYAEVLRAVRVR